MSDLLLWGGVGVAGGLGALARFSLDRFVSARAEAGFPFGTFAVNVSGAAVLGVLSGAAVHGDALLLAGGGVLGSYTTFSTWMLETHRLSEDGAFGAAALNVGLSLLVGGLAFVVGRWAGGLL